MSELAHESATDSYDPGFFELVNSVESRHFWFRARRYIIIGLVRQIAAEMKGRYLVLEPGCGSGNVLQALEKECSRGTVIGMDLFSEGLQFARRRVSSPLVQGDINHLPFRKQFDLIGCFDVLEHQPDDMRVLLGFRSMLRDGGVLVMTVPANPFLWSYFDEASKHHRRYRLVELENKLLSTGYDVEFITHYMLSIFPLMWLRRRLNPLVQRPAKDNAARVQVLAQSELRVVPVVNNLLCFLLSQEARLIVRRRHLPMGTSLLAVARRTGR